MILDSILFKVLSFPQISLNTWNMMLTEMLEINYLKLIHWFVSGDDAHLTEFAMITCKVLFSWECYMKWNEKIDYL